MASNFTAQLSQEQLPREEIPFGVEHLQKCPDRRDDEMVEVTPKSSQR
jgi:hypothetical protein